MTKAQLKSSSSPLPIQHGTDKTAAQLVAEQHNAGIPPGPKQSSAPVHLETVTRLDSGEAAEYFLEAATAVANDAKRMICAGVVCYFISRHFSQATVKPELGLVDTTLLGKLINGGAGKGMSTLKAWITTSRRIYLRMTNPTGAKQLQEKYYAGIVNDVRTAKSVEAATEIVQRWLCKQVIAGGDGKEYNAGDSIDLMQRWADYVPQVQAADKPRAKELNSAGAAIARNIETMIEKVNASPREVAETVVNNIAASRSGALDLINAARARIADNIAALEKDCYDGFVGVVAKDRARAHKILDDMTTYLASADKVASEAPLKPDPKPSPTATAENTDAAAKANTAHVETSSEHTIKLSELSDQPTKPASKAKKRAA